MQILHFEDLGDTECCLASNTVVLVPGEYQGGIYPHIQFERDRLNIRVRVFTLAGSTGGSGGDAKTIISPNTSLDDIIT